ncbi:hypothetical protein D6D29_05411 [Aureobasidium pullulans]|nr:hypothetical protein D6D29_05411 [Aureobasidium pullulans]
MGFFTSAMAAARLACARRTLSNGIDAIIAKAEPVQPTDPSVKTFETLESLEVMSPRYLLVDAAHPDICRPVLNPKNFAFGTNNAREHEQDRRELCCDKVNKVIHEGDI